MSDARSEVSVQRAAVAERKRRGPAWFRNPDSRFFQFVRPIGTLAIFFTIWGVAVRLSHSDLFPTPIDVAAGIVELIEKGLLAKYIVASLFRVTWGFTLAVLIGVPSGLFLGWYSRAFQAFNPIIQILRPISPIAWIPVAILWFGVSDAAPIFLIFLASVFPITVSAMAAVQNMQPVYLRAAQNFGLSRGELFRRLEKGLAARRLAVHVADKLLQGIEAHETNWSGRSLRVSAGILAVPPPGRKRAGCPALYRTSTSL
jgi:ABC-type proline/glycine betaine transport system permease subunit